MVLAWFRPGFVGLALVLILAEAARAQFAAASMEELKILVNANANVTVTDTRGEVFRGTLTDASPSRLALRTGNDIRWFEAADVASVRVRKEDSLANGALIGAAVAGGLTSLAFLDNECRVDPVCYQAVAVYAGIGALAGLGIDALIHGSVVVYRAPGTGDRHLLTLAPIVAPRRTGLRLMIAF